MTMATASRRAPAAPEAPMTVREVAVLLQVAETTVREWLRNGRIRGIKLQGETKHRWRIPRSEVDRLTQ
jgi:excisionase family DNA binding protein